MLGLLCDAHADLESLLLDYNLVVVLSKVHKQAKLSKQVVVAGMCDELDVKWRSSLAASGQGLL